MTDKPAKISEIKETPLPKDFKISVDHWLMGDHIDWAEAATKGDVLTLNRFMATCVKEWPYQGLDCTEELDYKKLAPKQWTVVIKAVGTEVNNAFLE